MGVNVQRQSSRRVLTRAEKQRLEAEEQHRKLTRRITGLEDSESGLRASLETTKAALTACEAERDALAASQAEASAAQIKAEEAAQGAVAERDRAQEILGAQEDRANQAEAAAADLKSRCCAAEETTEAMKRGFADAQEARKAAQSLAESADRRCALAESSGREVHEAMQEADALYVTREDALLLKERHTQTVLDEVEAAKRQADERLERVRRREKAQQAAVACRTDRLSSAKADLDTKLETCQEVNRQLVERLAQPRPALEVLRGDINGLLDFLSQSISAKVSEQESLRRNQESLRWKVIRSRVAAVAEQVTRTFAVLTPPTHDSESKTRERDAELVRCKAEAQQQRTRATAAEAQQDMLSLLFHPVPSLLPTSGKNLRTLAPGVPGAPVPVRARLILSEIRADKVHEVVEKHRTWDARRSTLLLACCLGCGAFFLEADSAWPCSCAPDDGSLHAEHEEYCQLPAPPGNVHTPQQAEPTRSEQKQ